MVRGLARVLGNSKPAVTRAPDRLRGLGYLRHDPDEVDRRDVLIQRTANGSDYCGQFAEMLDAAARSGKPG